MIILGINSYHPDSSAALVIDGRLIAACEEERFRRVKHFSGFPTHSLQYCLKEGNVELKDIDYIAIPRQPKARLMRKIFYGIKIPELARRRLFAWEKMFAVKDELAANFGVDAKEIEARIIKVEHHHAHIASSFFVSGFRKAAILSADALGDFASTVWGLGEGNKIKIKREVAFPHSLGFYYTALTQYLGFLNFGDEYKVMGLAAFGEASYEDEFRKILEINGRGFKLGLKYFLHDKKLVDMDFEGGHPKVDTLFSPYLEKRLGKRRMPEGEIEKRHKDIACSLQKRLEEALLNIVNSIAVDSDNLCLSGGVAFNCVANAKISANSRFKNIYVPPACGDAGLALGAAYYVWNSFLDKPRACRMSHAYWGPEFSGSEIGKELDKHRAELSNINCSIETAVNDDDLACKIAREISSGKIVGWFQGRMEWGPRALGSRSILTDPRRREMKDIINSKIKRRESFRPFAPSILEEYAGEYFEGFCDSPFMLFALKVREDKKNLIPAVVHVDGTARLQTVNKESNPLYWKLINEFNNITGVPVLLNTSFNENEPVVCAPAEAIDCFLRSNIDILVLGNYIIKR